MRCIAEKLLQLGASFHQMSHCIVVVRVSALVYALADIVKVCVYKALLNGSRWVCHKCVIRKVDTTEMRQESLLHRVAAPTPA